MSLIAAGIIFIVFGILIFWICLVIAISPKPARKKTIVQEYTEEMVSEAETIEAPLNQKTGRTFTVIQGSKKDA